MNSNTRAVALATAWVSALAAAGCNGSSIIPSAAGARSDGSVISRTLSDASEPVARDAGPVGDVFAAPATDGAVAMSARWGMETPDGPRVSGMSAGTKMVEGADGGVTTATLYDSNGDGTPDEIDVDGDGVSDGEDIDGDGEITLWDELPADDDDTTQADVEGTLPVTPPGAERLFASEAPLPGESATGVMVGTTGGVDLVDGGVPVGGTHVPGVLTARQQYGLGACGNFAASAAVALLRYNRERAATPTVAVDDMWPSPLALHQQLSHWNGGRCGGTQLTDNLERFLFHGAAAESEVPYPMPVRRWPTAGTMSYCTPPATDPAASSPHREDYRIGGYVYVPGARDVWREEVQRQLAMGRPVIFGVQLPGAFGEFRATAAAGAGMATDVTQPFHGSGPCITHPGDLNHCAGHAMVITGYDDDRSAYRVLNSWGTDWGDHGYLWWDYAALEALGPVAYAVMPLPTGTAALTTPRPAKLTVSVEMMTSPVLTHPSYTGMDAWAVVLRVRWSEPVRVRTVVSTVDGRSFNGTFGQAMLAGDLHAIVPQSHSPTAPTPWDPASLTGHTMSVTITARTSDGVEITRTLTDIAIPAPTMDP